MTYKIKAKKRDQKLDTTGCFLESPPPTQLLTMLVICDIRVFVQALKESKISRSVFAI